MLLCACCLACLGGATAEEMNLPSVQATLAFPDAWLVVTPASLSVYRAILSEAGMDMEDMEARFNSDGVVAEGWAEDYADSYRLMVREDERSQRIFDIGRATAAQRKAIAASFTDKQAWRLTSLRYQEATWQNHPTMGRFLFLRYNVVEEDEIVERGVQYFTIRNGRNYILDWTIRGRRFTNKDLAYFKGVLAGLAFTEQLPAPPLPLSLSVEGGMPTETGSGQLTLRGKTESEAGLVLSEVINGQHETLSISVANREGSFVLNASLSGEGSHELVLTASKEGYQDAQITETLLFQPGLLPINFDALPDTRHEGNSFTLSGRAPAGTQLQLLTGQRAIERRVGSNGRFSIDMDTSQSGPYSWTLIADHKGYSQRRIAIEFVREYTQEQELETMRRNAGHVSYAQLTSRNEAYKGRVLAFVGTVLEITEGEGTWFLRLDVSARNSRVPEVVVFLCSAEPTVTQDQRVTCYGLSSSAYIEQTVGGADTVIPCLLLLDLQR